MKKSMVSVVFFILFAIISDNAISYPVQLLPMDENTMTQIGTGGLSTIFGTGSFYSYDVTDTNLNIMMLKMTATNGSDGGLGAIQLFDGTNQLLIPYAASSNRDWFNQQSDTQYSTGIIEPLDPMDSYAIHRASYNGNNNFAGEVNNNYTYHRDGSNVMYYYVAFDRPVHVTDVKLGNGTNRNITYNIEFFSKNDETVIPEPEYVRLSV